MQKFIQGQRKIVLWLVCGVIGTVILYLGVMGRTGRESVIAPVQSDEAGVNKDIFLAAGNGVLRDPFRVKSTVTVVEASLPTMSNHGNSEGKIVVN